MRKHKKFDCVEMKWRIQRQIADEFAHCSDREMHQVQKKGLEKNSILEKFVNKIRIINSGSLTYHG